MINYFSSNYADFIEQIMSKGEIVTPRGIPTTEVTNAHIEMSNPRERIIFDPARKMNVGFAIAEFFQMMTGGSSLYDIGLFNSNMKKFSFRDVVDAAYGPRIVSEQQNQIEDCIQLLKRDPASREAVITIHRKEDLHKWNNIPCTLSLHFLLRLGSLDCITTMRSNDAVWGFTYDIFAFTMLQEYIACRLDVMLGTYCHNVGSLHVYHERDAAIINQLANISSAESPGMNEMVYAPKFQELYDMSLLLFAVVLLPKDKEKIDNLNRYWKELIYTAREFIHYRMPRTVEFALTDPALDKILAARS